jgi:osmotically-inducible protein OsmY
MWSERSSRLRQVVIALSATLLVPGCATHPPRTPDERAADEQLATRVEQVLLRDQNLYARHVDVDAEYGIVRLSGYVWSTQELYEAERIAATVSGVRRVDSQLELMVGGRAGAR